MSKRNSSQIITSRKMSKEELAEHLNLRGRGGRHTDRAKEASRRACRQKVRTSDWR